MVWFIFVQHLSCTIKTLIKQDLQSLFQFTFFFVLFVLEKDFSKSELMTICFDDPNMINHLTILDKRNIIITLKVEIFQDYLLDHLKLGLLPNEWYYVQPCVNIHNQQI